MTVNKLQRFAEIADFDHVLEYTDFHQAELEKPIGQWSDIFGNDHSITLELACGTGAYTLELARRNPDRNFIGIDIKGARIWKGAKRAKAENLDNVRFLRMYIDHLEEYFAPGEVSEIWITFPDPYPRARDRNNRLSSPKFLEQYQRILQLGGLIHFKTDDDALFKYSCRRIKEFGGTILEQIEDIYGDRSEDPRLTIKTKYENKHLRRNKDISYCKFYLSSSD